MRLQVRHEVFENRLLDGFTFGRSLDHQIGLAQISQPPGGADAGHGSGFGIGSDLAACDLTVDVAVYQGNRGRQAFGFHVSQHHVKPGKGKDMRNAAAHLTCTHDTD